MQILRFCTHQKDEQQPTWKHNNNNRPISKKLVANPSKWVLLL
jgi:hypothetical protein